MTSFTGKTIFIFFIFSIVFSQDNNSPLKIPFSSSNISIDGDLSDWKNFLSYTFQDTLTSFNTPSEYPIEAIYPPEFDITKIKKPKSKNKVVFYSYWNTQNLYFAFQVFDKHLFAEKVGSILKSKIHLNDGIEIYIDSKYDSDKRMDVNDYQFIIDIKNNTEVFRGNLKLILSDTLVVPKEFAQNIFFKRAVKVVGDINDQNEKDSLFIVEAAIPFAAIGLESRTGMKMKFDVCVNDIDFPADSAVQIEETSTILWSFNWSGFSDYGYPQNWKVVQLTGAPSWYEKVSEKYKTSWFWIYFISVVISSVVIILLVYRNYRTRKLSTSDQIPKEKIIFVDTVDTESKLSFNEKILKQASEFIIKNKTQELHSEDVAKNIGISLRNFQRITKQELRITPTNFICIVKLKLAADYLKHKEGNITEATYEFGFSDPSYFSKVFKNHFGVSPSDYVKNNS